MSRRRAALIADVSPDIGAGHLARCATLARALRARGWACTMVTREGAPESLLAGLNVAAFDGAALTDAARIGAAIGDVDALVVDHYGLGAVFESACRSWARCVVAIDDAPTRAHDCDVLLDQTAGRDARAYAAFTPPAARVLAGALYALVGDAFRARRADALARRRGGAAPRRVLLSFGATDPANVTARALRELLQERAAEQITVLLSESAPHSREVEALTAASNGRAELILGAGLERIADCLAEADIALGAAGSSAWERCCLGLPSAVVVVADNQRDIAAALSAAGAALDLGALSALPPGAFARAACALAEDAAKRGAMIEAAAALCDGEGADRVVEAIEQMCDAERT